MQHIGIVQSLSLKYSHLLEVVDLYGCRITASQQKAYFPMRY